MADTAVPLRSVPGPDPTAQIPMKEFAAVLATVFWLAPVVWCTGRIADKWDDAMATLAVATAIGWSLWKNWPERIAPPSGGWRVVLALSWGAVIWLMAGLHVEDFWLVRAALPWAVAAGVVLFWGWRGLWPAWRALVVASLWAVAPFTGRVVGWDSHGAISEWTAGMAGIFLWPFHPEVVRHGAMLTLTQGSVTVLTACTGAPLAEVLLRLLLPICVALALPWRRAMLAAVVTLPLAFAVASGRAAVMAVVVADHARFEFWHGPEGGSVFTAVAMGLLAGLVAWMLPPPVALRTTPAQRLVARRAWWSLGVVVAAGGLAWTRPVPGEEWAVAKFSPPAPEGWSVAPSRPLALPSAEESGGGRPLRWAREYAYAASASGARLTVRVGVAPRWLDGDPAELALAYGWLPRGADVRAWTVAPLAAGAGRQRVEPGHLSLLVAVSPEGQFTADAAAWLARTTAWPLSPARWLAWLRGESALRDKRGVWLMLDWEGNVDEAARELPRFLQAWGGLAPSLTSFVPP